MTLNSSILFKTRPLLHVHVNRDRGHKEYLTSTCSALQQSAARYPATWSDIEYPDTWQVLE